MTIPTEKDLHIEASASASRGKRFIAAMIDLILVPVLLGAFLALFTFWLFGTNAFNFLFYLVYVGWVIFRDTIFSPGRSLVGISLISLEGEKVTVQQAFKRNLLIILPFIGILGYLVEMISLIMTGERVMDSWAKTKVIDHKVNP